MSELRISSYWKKQGKTLDDRKHGKVWTSDKIPPGEYRCDECCNGDRCDEPGHYYRPECPFCLGTGHNLGPVMVPATQIAKFKEMAEKEIQRLEEKRKEIYKGRQTIEIIQNFSYTLHEIESRIQSFKDVLEYMKELKLI